MRFLSTILFALVLTSCCVAQSTAAAKPSTPDPVPPQSSSQPSPAADQQALRADIQRIRSLLNQMEVNLAFAQVGETPAKHQFELEIGMWHALLDHMERQVTAPSAATPTPPRM